MGRIARWAALPLVFAAGCNLGALYFAEGEGLPCDAEVDCAPGLICDLGVCAPGFVEPPPEDAGPEPVEEDAGPDPVEDAGPEPVEDAGPGPADAGPDAGGCPTDTDGDGYGFECPLGSDCAPDDPDRHTTRLFFPDPDEDGLGSGTAQGVCAGDGTPTGFTLTDDGDNCPDVANPGQADRNNDGEGNVCDDEDGDGVVDSQDNCPDTDNPGQADRNNDGEGNACDDEDGDEVTDANDNCPDDANADQHDEDGDDVGDICDNCPADANAAQEDTTETNVGNTPDGVGDACDPQAEQANAILLFDPFTSFAAEWSGARDGYIHTGDGIEQTEESLNDLLFRSDIRADDVRIEASVEALGGDLSGGNANVGIVVHYDELQENGRLCTVRADNSISFELSLRRIANGNANDEFEGAPLAELFIQHRLTFDVSNGDYVCAHDTGVATSSNEIQTGDRVGLRTNDLLARFDWWIAYSLVP